MRNPALGRAEVRMPENVRPEPARGVLQVGLVALAGSIAIVALLFVARAQRARADVAPSAAHAPTASPKDAPLAPPAPPEPALVTTPVIAASSRVAPTAPSAPPVPFVPGNKGDIVPPKGAAGHRIYVDGAVVGEGTATLRVDCGEHRLRIGSAGKDYLLRVPCGETIELR